MASPHLVGLSITFDQANLIFEKHRNEHVKDMIAIKTGFNNKVYLVQTKEGGHYALRITKETWPSEKVDGEVAALSLAATTKIPVPKVFFWGSGTDEIGCRYIVMECIQGECLADVWSTFSILEKRKIIQQVVQIMVELQSQKFDLIGGLHFKSDKTITVGPYFTLKEGPFSSVLAWYTSLFNNSCQKIRTEPLLSENFSQYIPRVQTILENVGKSRLLENVPIVFFHGDFTFRNMMVKGDTITGVVDWEWAGAFPIDKDWFDGLDELNASGDISLFWEEANKEPLLRIPDVIEGFQKRKELVVILQAIAPWEVGCFGKEKDQHYIQNAKKTLNELLPQYENMY